MDGVSQLNKVYGSLEDRQSKDIFLWKMNYLVTGDKNYIKNVVDNYLQGFHPWIFTEVSDLIDSISDEMILWGCGTLSIENLWVFKEKSARIFAFCDRNTEKQKTGFMGYKVISPEELSKHTDKTVIISTWFGIEEMRKTLHMAGFSDNKIFVMPHRHEKEDQYFDKEIIKLADNEVFIDDGCYDLGTTVEFVKRCPGAYKVVAFEPDSGSYQVCRDRIKETGIRNIELLPYGTWSDNSSLSFQDGWKGGSRIVTDGNVKIETVTIDEIAEKETVTFIKMDIEGAELESLKGAERIIKRDKPKLAICIYHKPSDLIDIPLYIKSIVPEYKLYIRHYSNDFTETVLYAVI